MAKNIFHEKKLPHWGQRINSVRGAIKKLFGMTENKGINAKNEQLLSMMLLNYLNARRLLNC